MNIEEQRESFEAWFESRYDAHFMQFALDLDLYVDKHTQTCWEAWLSSANREGYKLVPLEPTLKMVRASEHIKSSKTIRQDIYKAMIEACNN